MTRRRRNKIRTVVRNGSSTKLTKEEDRKWRESVPESDRRAEENKEVVYH